MTPIQNLPNADQDAWLLNLLRDAAPEQPPPTEVFVASVMAKLGPQASAADGVQALGAMEARSRSGRTAIQQRERALGIGATLGLVCMAALWQASATVPSAAVLFQGVALAVVILCWQFLPVLAD